MAKNPTSRCPVREAYRMCSIAGKGDDCSRGSLYSLHLLFVFRTGKMVTAELSSQSFTTRLHLRPKVSFLEPTPSQLRMTLTKVTTKCLKLKDTKTARSLKRRAERICARIKRPNKLPLRFTEQEDPILPRNFLISHEESLNKHGCYFDLLHTLELLIGRPLWLLWVPPSNK